MVRGVVDALVSQRLTSIRVVDPFCGDGRLLEWFLEEWPDRSADVSLEAWDTDPELVKQSSFRLRSALSRLSQAGSVVARCGDTFRDADRSAGKFDAVITNPPWDAVKPDRRHMKELPPESQAAYLQGLKSFDVALAQSYPEAQPSRKFAGWGTNLSRVGMAVSQRLTRSGGHISIVMPGSVIADSNHSALRASITEASTIMEVAAYPAEARLFDGVDVHFVTIELQRSRGEGNDVRLVQFDSRCEVASDTRARQPNPGEAEWLFPLHPGALPATVLDRLGEFPTLGDLILEDGYWAGRELDETRLADRLRPVGVPLLKGRNVTRYSHEFESHMLVDPELAAKFPSTLRPRLVWRDVSRPSQRRRVQATVIPPNSLTGNSLGVLTVPKDDTKILTWLLGIFSSAVFESQLRSLLATGHVTLASLRKVRVPRPTGSSLDEISTLATSQLQNATATNQHSLELASCAAYGLSGSEIAEFFSQHEWLPDSAKKRAFRSAA